MSVDIFLSYEQTDQTIAGKYAAGFEAAGLTVELCPSTNSGKADVKAAAHALATAKAVVVLWSQASVTSKQVLAQAAAADRNGRLVPAQIENCLIPPKFEWNQTVELQAWAGDDADQRWRYLLTVVKRAVGGERMVKRKRPGGERWKVFVLVAEVVVLVMMLVGIYLGLHQN